MALGHTVILLLLFGCHLVSSQTVKSGCSYDGTAGAIGVFSCDFTLVTFPISYSEFNNPRAQRLRIYKIDGELKASGPKTFSGFASMTTLDPDYTAYLELECSTGATPGALILSSGTFVDMGHLQELYIKNCLLEAGLPSFVFINLNSLHILTMEGGKIEATYGDSLSSFSIDKTSTLNKPRAILNLTNIDIIGGTFASGFFYPLTEVETIILSNNGITSFDRSEFSQNTQVQTLVLRDNGFTTLPNNMFEGLNSLERVDVSGTGWDCSCDALWFVPVAVDANFTISDSLSCYDAASNGTKNGVTYYHENCVTYDICSGIKGIIIDNYCHKWFEILFYILLWITFIIALTALIMICYIRHVLMTERDKLNAKRAKAWNKIQEVLKEGVNGNQKPPAATGPPKQLKW
ncbi:hypothetical protein FSP39_007932 [Pinctada imbricata]|uniref:Uncharacterized protein n=1 Tax=Pinctada imbricata TaxID=66713 RepID=A0AA89C1C2_PINIB|nr:hypothetical protein FSP39_007932 [Pinctada imbricata]